jgi:hypothetical protein
VTLDYLLELGMLGYGGHFRQRLHELILNRAYSFAET